MKGNFFRVWFGGERIRIPSWRCRDLSSFVLFLVPVLRPHLTPQEGNLCLCELSERPDGGAVG